MTIINQVVFYGYYVADQMAYAPSSGGRGAGAQAGCAGLRPMLKWIRPALLTALGS